MFPEHEVKAGLDYPAVGVNKGFVGGHLNIQVLNDKLLLKRTTSEF